MLVQSFIVYKKQLLNAPIFSKVQLMGPKLESRDGGWLVFFYFFLSILISSNLFERICQQIRKKWKLEWGPKFFITIIQSLQKSSFLKASLNIFIMLFAMNVKVAQSARSAPSAQCCPVSRAALLRPAAPFLFQLKKNLLNDLKQLFVRFIFRQ